MQTTAPCRRKISFSEPVSSHSRFWSSAERFHTQMKRGRRPASCAGPQTDFARTIAPHGRADRAKSLRPSSGPLQRKRTNQWIGLSTSATAVSNMTPRCFRKRPNLQRLWRRRTAHPNATAEATPRALNRFPRLLRTPYFALLTSNFAFAGASLLPRARHRAASGYSQSLVRVVPTRALSPQAFWLWRSHPRAAFVARRGRGRSTVAPDSSRPWLPPACAARPERHRDRTRPHTDRRPSW